MVTLIVCFVLKISYLYNFVEVCNFYAKFVIFFDIGK